MINCLKESGVKIQENKYFMELCKQGESTLNERYNFFVKQENEIEKQIAKLYETLEIIKYKEWYYQTSLEKGEVYKKHLYK